MVVGTLQRHQTPQRLERLGIIIHSQVEHFVHPSLARRLRSDHDERRRLLPADVAADGLRRVERGEQSIGEVAVRFRVSPGHRRPDFVVGHEVRLSGEILSGRERASGRSALQLRSGAAARCCSPSGLDVARACERGHVSRCVDHRHLPDLAGDVRAEKSAKRLRRRFSGAQKIEPELSVRGIDEALCRHRADSRLGPRHNLADGEPVRLHRHTHLACLRIPRDDRECVDRADLRQRGVSKQKDPQ